MDISIYTLYVHWFHYDWTITEHNSVTLSLQYTNPGEMVGKDNPGETGLGYIINGIEYNIIMMTVLKVLVNLLF